MTLHRGMELANGLRHPLCVVEHHSARIGQRDRSAFTVEQGLAQFILKLANLPAEWRLSDAQ